MYSEKWSKLAKGEIDDPVFDAAIAICREYNLGGSFDPRLIYDIIRLTVAEKSNHRVVYILPNGDVEVPEGGQ